MLSRFDDYPIHQTPEPIAHRGTSDPNAEGRCWWSGVDQHLHNGVRARAGAKRGVGVLEQILIGPHAGYGFSGLVDGATAPGLQDGATAPGLPDGARA